MLLQLSVFVIYQVLQIILLPFIIIFMLIIQRKKRILGSLKERLGFIPKTHKKQSIIWFHAVSVGEVLAVQELVHDLQKKQPGTSCYITVGTIAAKKMAHDNIKAHHISFLPYDFLPCMLLAYFRIRPKAIIIVEADLWPNLILIGWLKKIPLYLLNARVNPRSQKKMGQLWLFFKAMYNSFTALYIQSERDLNQFKEIGVNPKKLNLLGNIKAFNVVAKKESCYHPSKKIKNTDRRYDILLAGSIHPTEDVTYLKMFRELKVEFPQLKLILAPRHFSWKEEFVKHVSETGFPFFMWDETVQLSSKQGQAFELKLDEIFETHEIILLCKLGELFTVYPYAEIFFLGGTFVPVGGHNLLEPAVWGVAPIIGPHYQNCLDIVDKLDKIDGIIKVPDNDSLTQLTRFCLTENRYVKIGKESKDWITHESEVVKQSLEHLRKELSS